MDSTTVAIAPILVPHTQPTIPNRFFLTRGHPINKQNFRYVPCGPSPNFSTHYPVYRIIDSPPVGARFSWEDRSASVYISADALSITTDKGFRSARANVPIREGVYYFEVLVERGGDEGVRTAAVASGAHVRVGVGRRECPLNAPVGFDGYSYGIRDRTGEKVTLSQVKPYGQPFITGDVIGVLVNLPQRPTTQDNDKEAPAVIERKRIPIRYKGQLYFESMEYPVAKEMTDLLDAITNKGAKKVVQKKKAAAPGSRRAPEPQTLPSRPLPILTGIKSNVLQEWGIFGSSVQ